MAEFGANLGLKAVERGVKRMAAKPPLPIRLQFIEEIGNSQITMEPPRGEQKYLNIELRKWYQSIDNGKNIEELYRADGPMLYTKELLGPWDIYVENTPIWVIFYWMDETKQSDHWCYCKHFDWDDKRKYKWKKTGRPQYRTNLTKNKLDEVVCIDCPFREMWLKSGKNLFD